MTGAGRSQATTLFDHSNGALNLPAVEDNFEVRLAIACTTDWAGVTRIDSLPLSRGRGRPAKSDHHTDHASDLSASASEINVTCRVGAEVATFTAPLNQAAAIQGGHGRLDRSWASGRYGAGMVREKCRYGLASARSDRHRHGWLGKSIGALGPARGRCCVCVLRTLSDVRWLG
jgi:hypothetical protein